ncbi:UNVERIFIED_CONTAM: hypothetical protein Slati_3079700 [Sesamum latifolium]|uniref:Reverse transcriptase n=1 Tax=Sesamum latifolium TaxID=2727402 RepID=A0AAW2UUN2_9LAMI
MIRRVGFPKRGACVIGFPEQFILWIEECVTTPSFSVCLNGSPHGFFRGARGYDRGTLCPHIFLCLLWRSSLLFYSNSLTKMADSLIIGCGELHLFQLGFADDLLLSLGQYGFGPYFQACPYGVR